MSVFERTDSYLYYKGRALVQINSSSSPVWAAEGEVKLSEKGRPSHAGKFYAYHPSLCQIEDDSARIVLKGVSGRGAMMRLHEHNGRLVVIVDSFPEETTCVRVIFERGADERVYGGGQRSGLFDLTGHIAPVFIEQPPVSGPKDVYSMSFVEKFTAKDCGADVATVYPQPTVTTSANAFFHVDTFTYSVLDLTDLDKITFEALCDSIKVFAGVFAGKAEMFENLTSLLGRSKPAPQWAYEGAVIELTPSAAAECESQLKELKDAGAQISAVVLKENAAPFSPGYPSWFTDDALVNCRPTLDMLNSLEIQPMMQLSLLLAQGSELYNRSLCKDVMIKDSKGREKRIKIGSQTYGIIDLSSQRGRNFLAKAMKDFYAMGFRGFVADGFPYVTGDIEPMKSAIFELNIKSPAIMARLLSDVSKNFPEPVWSVIEGGSSASNLFTQTALLPAFDIRSVPAAVSTMLSLSMTGVGQAAVSSYDLSEMDTEEASRFLETISFFPFFWVKGLPATEITPLFMRSQSIFAQLREYRLAQISHCLKTGMTPVKPLLMADETLLDCGDGFMYGDDILVYPTWKGEEYIEIDIPEGAWTHFFTGESFESGKQEVYAPVGTPAVFYRTGCQFAPLFEKIRASLIK